MYIDWECAYSLYGGLGFCIKVEEARVLLPSRNSL